MDARERVAWNVRRLRVERGIAQEALAVDAERKAVRQQAEQFEHSRTPQSAARRVFRNVVGNGRAD